MKKFLLVLAIGAFVACNDNSNADEKATDTIPVPAAAPVEPVAPVLDSAAAVVDSAASAVVDSLKK